MIRLYSEWDLGIPEFYANIDLAYEMTKKALVDVVIEDDIDELVSAGLIQFEIVDVFGEQDYSTMSQQDIRRELSGTEFWNEDKGDRN